MPLKLIFISFLFVVLFTSFIKKEKDTWVYFPSQVGTMQTCVGQDAELEIEISTNSEKEIKAYSFDPGIADFTLSRNGKEIKKTDTLYFSEKSPVKLTVKYKLGEQLPDSLIFKTDHPQSVYNKIKLVYGEYFITSKAVREGKKQVINVSESCTDSLKVYFPYGGKVSSATLYKELNSETVQYKSVCYGFGDTGNYLYFSKADKGHYLVKFGSCHWGNEFWLTIK